jgi:hypothetical protein
MITNQATSGDRSTPNSRRVRQASSVPNKAMSNLTAGSRKSVNSKKVETVCL